MTGDWQSGPTPEESMAQNHAQGTETPSGDDVERGGADEEDRPEFSNHA
jgi:hypothetical protein